MVSWFAVYLDPEEAEGKMVRTVDLTQLKALDNHIEPEK